MTNPTPLDDGWTFANERPSDPVEQTLKDAVVLEALVLSYGKNDASWRKFIEATQALRDHRAKALAPNPLHAPICQCPECAPGQSCKAPAPVVPQKPKLLACPFCGCARVHSVFENRNPIPVHYKVCADCGARGAPSAETDAAEAWNTRCSPATPDARVEQTDEAIVEIVAEWNRMPEVSLADLIHMALDRLISPAKQIPTDEAIDDLIHKNGFTVIPETRKLVRDALNWGAGR